MSWKGHVRFWGEKGGAIPSRLIRPSLEEKPKYKFKGIREERGLYKTQEGKYINADVNAAANIIKKRKHEFNYERLYKWVQTAPIKIKLQT